MNQPEQRKCKGGCGTTIMFVKGETGKLVPLDLSAPVYEIVTDMTGDTVAKRVGCYVSHFSTCPKADDFSATKRRTS